MGRTLLGAGHWNLKVMELEVGIPLPRGRYSISSMSQPSQKHHTTSPLLESLSFRFSVCTTVPQFNINKVIASHSTVSVEEASQTGSAMSVRSRLHAQLYEASCQMLQGPLPKKKKKKKTNWNMQGLHVWWGRHSIHLCISTVHFGPTCTMNPNNTADVRQAHYFRIPV